MDREELSHWLRLHLTPGVGNTTARELLTAFGLPPLIFAQNTAALGQVATARQVAALQQEPAELQALLHTTWEWLQADLQGRRVLTLSDPCYPRALLNIEDPPLLLYAMGATRAWQADGLANCAERSVAVVGSRNPTPQGLANARQFSHVLAQAGLTVVSGLALGVDGAAHAGALEGASTGQLASIAVVGTGLDRVYPKQHLHLAHQLAVDGVVLSEYPLGTPPLAANFPKRNRLIAGLSCGTLVVEAALQSGSLITARMAADQGKEVFAIPGSIHSPQARGCHALIKQGAKLVECAQDVLEELNLPSASASTAPTHPSHERSSTEEATLLHALGFDPTGLDALINRTGLDAPTLQAQLMALELQNKVVRLPGGLFQRVALA